MLFWTKRKKFCNNFWNEFWSELFLCVKNLIPWHFLFLFLLFCWMLHFSQTASYEIILISQFVCLSLSPSVTKFSKDVSLVFSDIVLNDSWPWYLVTHRARFLKKKKKNAGLIWAKCAKIRPKNKFFTIFSSSDH